MHYCTTVATARVMPPSQSADEVAWHIEPSQAHDAALDAAGCMVTYVNALDACEAVSAAERVMRMWLYLSFKAC